MKGVRCQRWQTRYFTPEEYLKLEREAPYKSEYYEGVIYGMAAARESHDLIDGNVLLSSANRLPI